jgi:hypothetical protein
MIEESVDIETSMCYRFLWSKRSSARAAYFSLVAHQALRDGVYGVEDEQFGDSCQCVQS